MKKHLSLAFRLLFALAGIGYIAFSLTWTDHVLSPPRTVLSDGRVLEEATDFKVIEGSIDVGATSPTLLIELNAKGQAPQRMTIAGSSVGEEGGFLRRPGIVSTLRHANFGLIALGLLLVFPIYPIQAVRWLMLMRCRGIDVTVGQSFKLVMVGSFFNYCMPGSTGGDLVKAYYAAKNSDRRADAVMSVIFDRIVGLLGLVLLAGLAGLFMLDNPTARIITVYIWGVSGIVTLLSAVYFSRRLRSGLGLEWLLSKMLPQGSILAKIDAAAVAYRDHKLTVLWTILLSLPVHLCLATATALGGYALGMQTDIRLLLTVVPVLFLVGALPISYQGFGLMEFVGNRFLEKVGVATFNQIAGMLLLIRLFQIVYSLAGSLYLLRGDIHMHPEAQGEGADAGTSAPGVAAPDIARSH